MARPKLTESEKLVCVNASVKPTLREAIRALASERRWKQSQAVAYLLESAANEQGLFERYRAQIEIAQREAKAA